MSRLGSQRLIALASDVTDMTRRFLDWWFGELAGLLPTRAVQTIMGRKRCLSINVRSDHFFVSGATKRDDTLLPFESNITMPPPLRRRLDQVDEVTLLLPREMVLRRIIEVPIAARSDLAGAVSFMVERQTPFPLELARYTFRVTARDKLRKIMRVELAVIARATLDKVMAMAARYDLPMIVGIQVDGDDSLPYLDFQPRRSRIGRGRSSWKCEPWKLILAGSLMLLLAGPFLVAARLHSYAKAMATDVATQAMMGRQGSDLRNELQTLITTTAFVPTRLTGPRAIEIITALTKALPDDTWVFSMELDRHEARLAGFSANVPGLIERLQAVPVFDAPDFRSPVLHGTAVDRFEISVHLRPSAP